MEITKHRWTAIGWGDRWHPICLLYRVAFCHVNVLPLSPYVLPFVTPTILDTGERSSVLQRSYFKTEEHKVRIKETAAGVEGLRGFRTSRQHQRLLKLEATTSLLNVIMNTVAEQDKHEKPEVTLVFYCTHGGWRDRVSGRVLQTTFSVRTSLRRLHTFRSDSKSPGIQVL